MTGRNDMDTDDSFVAHPYAAHKGFSRVFKDSKLTLDFILPVEGYPNTAAPTMAGHAGLTRLADELGFAALWARDVALYDPHFGDTGQGFETFSYLGFLAANTQHIALATGSAVITLRHAASIDVTLPALIQKHGGKVLAKAPVQSLEGQSILPGTIVMIEFPSQQQALAWNDDPEHTPLKQLRQGGSSFDLMLLNGL